MHKKSISLAVTYALATVMCVATSSAEEPFQGDAEYGAYLSGECTACHQIDGATTGGIPSIVGWEPLAFVAVMDSYANKVRENVTMQTIAGSLDDEQIAALAAYYATIPYPE